MYMLSIQIHPHYSHDLRAHARRPLRLSTSAKLRKHAEIRLLPPPAVKLRELKLKRESEQTRARTRKLDRPAAAFRHPTDGKL